MRGSRSLRIAHTHGIHILGGPLIKNISTAARCDITEISSLLNVHFTGTLCSNKHQILLYRRGA